MKNNQPQPASTHAHQPREPTLNTATTGSGALQPQTFHDGFEIIPIPIQHIDTLQGVIKRLNQRGTISAHIPTTEEKGNAAFLKVVLDGNPQAIRQARREIQLAIPPPPDNVRVYCTHPTAQLPRNPSNTILNGDDNL